MREGSRSARTLALFSVLLFAGPGIHMPFWPLWLAGHGLDEAAIGVVLATGVWTRVILVPPLVHLASGRLDHRQIISVLALALALTMAAHHFVTGFSAYLALGVVFGAAWAGMVPLTDSLTLLEARAGGFDYGQVRRWGSISFLVASLLGGLLLRGRPVDAILWTLVGLFAALTAAARVLLRSSAPASAEERRLGLRDLPRPWSFVLLQSSTALIQGSHGMLIGLGTLHWRGLGHHEDAIGALWTAAIVAEVVLFSAGAALLRGRSPLGLVALGAAGAAIRWAGLAVFEDFWVLLFWQLLHGLSFGASHLGVMLYLDASVPRPLSALAQGLHAAISHGLGLGLGIWAAGRLYAELRGDTYAVMALFAALSLAPLAALALRERGRAAQPA